MTFVLNPFVFGGGVEELARDTSFYTDGTAQTIYTSDARNIGTASATRRVYALIFGQDGDTAGRTISSVTIGGVAATVHATASIGASATRIAAIYSAVVPTGTTAQVVVTFSAAINGCAIAVIALDQLLSGTPVDTGTATGTTDAISTGPDVDFSAGGYAMAIAAAQSDGADTPTAAWTGITEFIDENFTTAVRLTAAAEDGLTDSTGNTISVTFSNIMAAGAKVLAVVSVR